MERLNRQVIKVKMPFIEFSTRTLRAFRNRSMASSTSSGFPRGLGCPCTLMSRRSFHLCSGKRTQSLLAALGRSVGAAAGAVVVVGGAYDNFSTRLPRTWQNGMTLPHTVRVGVVVAPVGVGVMVGVLVGGGRAVVAAAPVVALVQNNG